MLLSRRGGCARGAAAAGLSVALGHRAQRRQRTGHVVIDSGRASGGRLEALPALARRLQAGPHGARADLSGRPATALLRSLGRSPERSPPPLAGRPLHGRRPPTGAGQPTSRAPHRVCSSRRQLRFHRRRRLHHRQRRQRHHLCSSQCSRQRRRLRHRTWRQQHHLCRSRCSRRRRRLHHRTWRQRHHSCRRRCSRRQWRPR
mmetsp:Transcript_60083/g.196218  ORF Transcript_60083/g.196218 Transcript_60083/m.196218 type:complete len:202 (-) Transcript_60083:531-1136(-)